MAKWEGRLPDAAPCQWQMDPVPCTMAHGQDAPHAAEHRASDGPLKSATLYPGDMQYVGGRGFAKKAPASASATVPGVDASHTYPERK